jgi:DNA-binding GntR family transcriptional regulator
MQSPAESPESAAPARSNGRAPGSTAAGVTERLRRQIQDGLLSPGEWLREARLCAEFEVGRSIVRRALQTLSDDGLVSIEPNRGASVTVTTLQEVFDLFELRASLYGVAARFACLRASPALMAEILEKADSLLADADAGGSAEDLIHQSEVIFSLMAAAGSADARRMIETVRRKTRWHISYMGLDESRPAHGPAERWQVFEHWRTMRTGLAARDPALAAEGARSILYFMQNEVSRMMLARGLGMQEPAPAAAGRRRTASRPGSPWGPGPGGAK